MNPDPVFNGALKQANFLRPYRLRSWHDMDTFVQSDMAVQTLLVAEKWTRILISDDRMAISTFVQRPPSYGSIFGGCRAMPVFHARHNVGLCHAFYLKLGLLFPQSDYLSRGLSHTPPAGLLHEGRYP